MVRLSLKKYEGLKSAISNCGKSHVNVNMIVRIIGLVFLFIIRIRFPRGKSIADIIRNRYGEAFVKKIRRFEKCDFKLRKCHLDLRFLLDCKKNGVIPKFLRFKLANRHLNNSHVYRKCQLRLLEEEIKSK